MTQLDPAEIGQSVKEEIARRRMSRQALADSAKISLSTLEKALAGSRPFTLATVIRIEDALGTRLRPSERRDTPNELAPPHLGSYSHAGTRWIEGRYLTLRPSFGNPHDIYTYVTDIRWQDEAGHLGFAESQRIDSNFAQKGEIAMPNLSGHIYLVTNDNGQHRMMVLGRPTVRGRMFGILTTLQVGHGSQLVPVSCPIAFLKWDDGEDHMVGSVPAGSPRHTEYRAIIDGAMDRDYARIYH